MKINKIKITAGLFILFFLGVFIGAMGDRIYIKHHMDNFMKDGGPPGKISSRLMRKLSKELDLTKEQNAEVEKIARQLRYELFEFKKKYQPEMEKIVERHILLVKEKLTPEQQKKMDHIYEQLKQRWPERKRIENPEKILLHLKKELNLSNEQINQMRPVIRQNFQKQHELIDKSRRKHRKSESFQIELQNIQKETEKNFEKILAPEQMAIFLHIQEEIFHIHPF